MGWPYVGETFQLYSSKNPNVFFNKKRNKYGPIFKTHILGCPCVMVSSPEAARFVLVTQAHLFKPTFPASKERMLGPQAIFFQQGDYHAHLRRIVSRAFSPESIRASVPAIEAIALRSLHSWDGQFVNTFQEMKTVSSYCLTPLPTLLCSALLCFADRSDVFVVDGIYNSTR
jgi:(+)-abscisic acid 8'-hydroxylase